MEIDITFILNDQVISSRENPATVLLDFIRKNRKLTGTKEVCKEGDCGACAVLIGQIKNGIISYKTINSCLFPIQKVIGKQIVTIEGLNQDSLSPIQQSFLDEGASQCGFCTPGFIISFTSYLLNSQKFNYDDSINSIAGNICRCTGYHSIQRSVKRVFKEGEKIDFKLLIARGIIPKYFEKIPKMLESIEFSDQSKIIRKKSKNKFISGGTDLFVQQPDKLLDYHIELIENNIKPNIKIDRNKIVISGSSTVEELKKFHISNNANLNLNKLFKLFASLPIRNSATIAGNIVNASPIADLTIALLALQASIKLRNTSGVNRIIPLNKFYKDYKTLDKTDDDIIESIYFNIPNKNSFFNFEKVSKRTHLDIASVNSAILVKLENDAIINSSISVGGVSPIPLYLKKTSEFLKEKVISKNLLDETITIALSEISPISDIRGSAEYKALLTQQLIKAHFVELFPKTISSEVLL